MFCQVSHDLPCTAVVTAYLVTGTASNLAACVRLFIAADLHIVQQFDASCYTVTRKSMIICKTLSGTNVSAWLQEQRDY